MDDALQADPSDENAALNELKVHYTGTATPLLKISIVTTLLTLITLGFYRFWARTRVRRYLWSGIRPGDSALEYNGTGLEKFLGFLIAVAVLAVYLGILQLLLSFAGMAIWDSNSVGLQIAASYISFFAVLPLIYYAQYRGRRYMLSRTRWRSLRFGAEQAAWGYVWEAIKNTFITIITFSILMHRQTFNLEKYRVDRSWYGEAKFKQGGDWRMLTPAMKHYYIGLGICLVAAVLFGIGAMQDFRSTVSGNSFRFQSNSISAALGMLLFTIGYPWLMVGLYIFQVASWRVMANHKTLGGVVRFRSEVVTSNVIMKYIVGGIASFFIAIIPALIIGAIIGYIASSIGRVFSLGGEQGAEGIGVIIGMAGGYLGFFLAIGIVVLVMITQPVLRLYASTVTIINPDALTEITQREGDDMIEAEGFADALDIGAAI